MVQTYNSDLNYNKYVITNVLLSPGNSPLAAQLKRMSNNKLGCHAIFCGETSDCNWSWSDTLGCAVRTCLELSTRWLLQLSFEINWAYRRVGWNEYMIVHGLHKEGGHQPRWFCASFLRAVLGDPRSWDTSSTCIINPIHLGTPAVHPGFASCCTRLQVTCNYGGHMCLWFCQISWYLIILELVRSEVFLTMDIILLYLQQWMIQWMMMVSKGLVQA